jgi:hypothetical protein
MKGNITEQGHFELFESQRGHRLLMLNDNAFYRWDWDTEVQKLYLTRGAVDKSGDNDYKVLKNGRYYLIHSTDGEFPGLDYLLLEDGNYFDTFRLPTLFPDSMDGEAEIVDVHERISAEEIDSCFYQISNG